MARPREFEEHVVLDAAVRCFWKQGYEGTSIRELMRATGLTGASLYNAFGDKRTLFHTALKHYVAGHIDPALTAHSMMPAREAIEGYLAEVVKTSLSDPEVKGCLIVNSALDVSPADPELGAFIAATMKRVEDFLRGKIEEGQRSGDFDRDASASDLAQELLSTLIGIRVLSRVRPEPQVLDAIVRTALVSLHEGRVAA